MLLETQPVPARRDRAESFLRHLEPLQGPLERYCRRLLYDGGSVADVLQSAVANAYRNFHLYAEGTNFRAWIFRHTHLEIQNWNRKRVRTSHAFQFAIDAPLLHQLLEAPEAVLEHCDTELAQSVRDLPETERHVLLLHAVGEFKYREIAEILQIPIGTVMSGLSRSRLRLRQRLTDWGEKNGHLHRAALGREDET